LTLTANELLDLFLLRVRSECKSTTLAWYENHLSGFSGTLGGVTARQLTPRHLTVWLDQHPDWNDSTRRGAITAVKAATSWAKKVGHLPDDPLANVSRPAMKRRLGVTPEVAAAIMSMVDGPFRELLDALHLSGCRPSEVYGLTASQIDLEAGLWQVEGKTGERTVWCSPALLDLSRRLVAIRPEGPVFLNSDGLPWNDNAVRCRFARINRKTGLKMTAYAFRHLYVTDGLANGLSDAQVAELVGHRDTSMIHKFYSKLDERTASMKAASAAIRPASGPASASGGGSDTPPSPPSGHPGGSPPRRRGRRPGT
jgi:integrase